MNEIIYLFSDHLFKGDNLFCIFEENVCNNIKFDHWVQVFAQYFEKVSLHYLQLKFYTCFYFIIPLFFFQGQYVNI